MARFLISAMPFSGHVAPMRAVAAALVGRGHDVRFYSGAAFRDAIESTGARFVPWQAAPDFDENDLQPTFPRLVGKKGFGQLLINVEDVFINTSPAQVEDLRAEAERETWDAIVGDEMSIGTALFAELTACPWATVAIVPLNLVGSQGPPSGMGIVPGRNPLTKARDAALRAAVPLISRSLSAAIGRARQSVELAPTRLTMDKLVFSPQLVVASGAPALDYERTDRPESLHFVGELRTPGASAAEDLPSWWSELEGRRVVHVTQGTQNIDPEDLIRPALEALADEDVLVVVTTGARGHDELPFPVPPNARVAGFLPHAELLPRVDAVITNGGWGGTLAALAHGIPLVIAGGDLDKPEIAARVAWAGAGVNLRTGTPSVTEVADGYRHVVTHPAIRDAAARVGAQLRSLGGAPRAAELLETLT
ncbi:nucleotide disphospho-sugar-binding domain-containing protein [Microbacterium sp. 2FI]|uniref:glycosyltransferase n=1 Tax=Microbacterium sp. 2FI TaxID=2502193 RepID=UPI0010F6B815|nr:nucleotide disphospho-sugar-binding domain-containing protein [Microbacterium sp. 2FI]